MKTVKRLMTALSLAASIGVASTAYSNGRSARLAEGTVEVGLSPEDSRPMYTTPADAPGALTWDAADAYCQRLDAFGHYDWRVPRRSELNMLFKNRAEIGGFDQSGQDSGWYWSSTQVFGDIGRGIQRFSDGNQDWYGKGNTASLRCVRG